MMICNGLLDQEQLSYSGLRSWLAHTTNMSIDRFSTNRKTSLARRLLHGPFQKTPLYNQLKRDAGGCPCSRTAGGIFRSAIHLRDALLAHTWQQIHRSPRINHLNFEPCLILHTRRK